MAIAREKPQLIVHGDGSVWRTAVCSCGVTIYKKNITSNEIEFLIKRDRAGFYLSQTISPHDRRSVVMITCPHCKAGHLVGSI